MITKQKSKKKICEYCAGTGEIETLERVYPGEPHMAPIGIGKCVCQISK